MAWLSGGETAMADAAGRSQLKERKDIQLILEDVKKRPSFWSYLMTGKSGPLYYTTMYPMMVQNDTT